MPYAILPNLDHFSIDIQTDEHKSRTIDTVSKTGIDETNGTLYVNGDDGTYFLGIDSNVKSYTIIVEQDVDSIPEFSSWIQVLFLLLIVTLVGVIYRRKMHISNKRERMM